MASDARMIGVLTDGNAARSISLDKKWIGTMLKLGFERRMADVGDKVLTYVTTLSATEAEHVNEVFQREVEQSLREFDSDPSNLKDLRHLHLYAVQCANEVSRLLQWVGRTSYSAPWVIVETADIDLEPIPQVRATRGWRLRSERVRDSSRVSFPSG